MCECVFAVDFPPLTTTITTDHFCWSSSSSSSRSKQAAALLEVEVEVELEVEDCSLFATTFSFFTRRRSRRVIDDDDSGCDGGSHLQRRRQRQVHRCVMIGDRKTNKSTIESPRERDEKMCTLLRRRREKVVFRSMLE